MVKKNIISLIAALFFLFIFNSYSAAYLSTNIVENNNFIEKIEFGFINWTTGIITVYGDALLPQVINEDKYGLLEKSPEKYARNLPAARQKAKDMAFWNAQQNLHNALLNLRINDKFYIKSYLDSTTNDFKFNLNNLILNNLKPKYIYQENSIRVMLQVPLHTDNGVISIFTNDYIPELMMFHTVSNYKSYVKKMFTTNNSFSQVYTSLIIDAGELKTLVPALFPRIYDESMNEVYSSKILLKKNVLSRGLVTYLPDITMVIKYGFIDEKSFIIKAIKTVNRTDLILPNEELKQFLSSTNTIKYLQNCNVIIIRNK